MKEYVDKISESDRLDRQGFKEGAWRELQVIARVHKDMYGSENEKLTNT